MGFDPDDAGLDPATPQGVGNAAAAAVIACRRDDGSNQLGSAPGGNGTPYADYTGYAPVDAPGVVVDPFRWMSIPFSDG